MKTFYMKKAFLTLGFLLLIPVFVIAQTFTIEQSVTGNNRSDIRGQVFIPSEQDNGTGTITSTGPVYLTAFDVVYDAGAEAPTLYIYSSLPTDLASLDDGTGGTLVGESTGKATGTFPYTTYSFDFLELDKNTTYYALFRQDVQLEFGGSGAIEGPYTGGKMLVNTGTAVAENNYSALKFIGTFENTLAPDQGDVDALISLYDATDGANWTNPWNLNGSPYDWYGVTWEGSRVTVVNLEDNNLVGHIPAELANATAIVSLNLSVNSLEGNIPVELGNMSSLTELHLYVNGLSGSIPPELGQLSNLIKLNLSTNNFTGSIPPELGNLNNLTLLRLFTNDLSGSIPPELGSLNNLTDLTLSSNSLSGSIPPELGQLTNLTVLYLYENELTGSIPAEFGNLTSLKVCFLSWNLLSDIAVDFTTMTSLQQLFLTFNLFDFGDIEPVIDFINSRSDYEINPQNAVPIAEDSIVAKLGTRVEIILETGGTSNNYEWFKGTQSLGISSSPNLVFNSFGMGNVGTYKCKITSTAVSGIELFSEEVKLDYSIGFRDGYPNIKEVTQQDITATISVDKDGTVYYVALPSKSIAPNTEQIIEGKNASGEYVATSGFKSIGTHQLADVVISGLESDLVYDVYFVAQDDIGTRSEVVELEAAFVTGLTDLFEENGFKLYPNPAGSQLFIELSNISQYDITITDLNGLVHYHHRHEAAGRAEINVSHLNAGIYMLQLRSDDKSGWMKIVKE